MRHGLDIGAIAAYVAGGGLAGAFVFLGTIWPTHASQFNGGAIALVALAGLVRVVANPTPLPGQEAVTKTKGTP
jgi:hypothetical protein